MVDGEMVQVFTYPSAEAAAAEADLVSQTGSSVGITMVSWIGPPHFYLKESLLVLYVGENEEVLGLLEDTLGCQFAGQVVPDPMGVPPLPVMRLVSEGQTYTGTEGSYCWPDAQTAGGEIVSICADKILWGKLLQDLDDWGRIPGGN